MIDAWTIHQKLITPRFAMKCLVGSPGSLVTFAYELTFRTKTLKSLMEAPNTCKEIYERWSWALFHARIEHIQPALKRGLSNFSLNPTCAGNQPQAG